MTKRIKEIIKNKTSKNETMQFFFIAGFILIVSYTFCIVLVNLIKGVSVLSFDDADKTNYVQIVLLCGTLTVIWEAFLARKDTYKLYEIENKPILTVSRKFASRGSSYWSFGFFRESDRRWYLAVSNCGKGTAFNVNVYKILDQNGKVNNLNICEHSQTIIPPNSEIAIKFKQEIKALDTLNNCQLFIEAETSGNKKYWFRYHISDIKRGYIRFIKMSDDEKNIERTDDIK